MLALHILAGIAVIVAGLALFYFARMGVDDVDRTNPNNPVQPQRSIWTLLVGGIFMVVLAEIGAFALFAFLWKGLEFVYSKGILEKPYLSDDNSPVFWFFIAPLLYIPVWIAGATSSPVRKVNHKRGRSRFF